MQCRTCHVRFGCFSKNLRTRRLEYNPVGTYFQFYHIIIIINNYCYHHFIRSFFLCHCSAVVPAFLILGDVLNPGVVLNPEVDPGIGAVPVLAARPVEDPEV